MTKNEILKAFASLVMTNKYTAQPRIPKDDKNIKKLNNINIKKRHEFPSLTEFLILSIAFILC